MTAPVAHQPAQTINSRMHRILMPRGIDGEYLAYEITNVDGEDFKIDEEIPEHDVLGRTIGGST